MRKLAVFLLVVVLGFSVSVYSQFRIDALREEDESNELLYLPNKKLLSHFTAGQNSLIASMLWLRCIQYTTKEFNRDHKFTWLEQMCDVITDLDPNFADVYQYGGMFLACMKGDDDASLNILNKGIRNNPEDWEIMWEASMVYLLNRRNEPGSPELAARYLAMAEKTGQAPGRVQVTLDGLSRRHGLYEIERARWENAAQSSDPMMRRMAERKLVELELRQVVDQLNDVVDRYKKETGASPTTLSDLATAGLMRGMPRDPLGGKFFIDQDGKMQNTSLLDSDLEARKGRLQAAIDKFRLRQGRPPKSLEELEATEFLIRIPEHPYKERQWQYNPRTGEIRG